jgi:enoyl-CoA hydratase
MRVATANARFGQPEVNLGIIPGYGGTQRLTLLVGRGKANELMMTGDMIGADEAKTLGLVNYVLPTKAEAMEKAEELILKIMSKAPLAIGMVVDCVNAVFLPEEDVLLAVSNQEITKKVLQLFWRREGQALKVNRLHSSK